MAILSVGEIAILLGNSYDSFEDFMFSSQGERFKYRWDRYDNFDMGTNSRVRLEMNTLVNMGVISSADCNAVFAESDKRDGKTTLKQLASRPIVTLFDYDNGKGYQVQAGYMKIRQEHAPAISGIHIMTTNQAQKLADFIADKMYVGLSPAVSPEQVQAVWDETATNQQLIDEEKALVEL